MLINDIDADLVVKTSSGSVTVSNVSSKNEVFFQTSSGSINIEDIKANCKATTASGKQIYKNIAGNIETHASSGDIFIALQKGVLKLKTSSGNINGEKITLTGDSFFTTSSGDISMDLTNPIEDFSFNVSASSGRLEAGSINSKKKSITGNGEILIKGKSSSGNQSYK